MPRRPEPPPPFVIRTTLAAARRAGVEFEHAWERALAIAKHEGAGPAWREAFEATRPSWEAAYRGDEHRNGERGLAYLEDDPERGVSSSSASAKAGPSSSPRRAAA